MRVFVDGSFYVRYHQVQKLISFHSQSPPVNNLGEDIYNEILSIANDVLPWKRGINGRSKVLLI